MLSAFVRRVREGTFEASCLEDTIRTLSVGLMALAAMMVSMSVARRAEPRRDEVPPTGRTHLPAPVNLDALRSAGL
jgi:hypothetical protein